MPGNPKFRSPSLAVRAGDWKLLADPDGSSVQLFNLAKDPGEQQNLAEQEPERAQALLATLRAWANEIGFGKPAAEQEAGTLPVSIGGRSRKLVNHGVRIDGTTWQFDGKDAWLDLPRADAPRVAGKALMVAATVEAAGASGVVLAHGGDRSGYALYLAEGRPAFSVCTNWTRTTVHGSALGKGEHTLEARLEKDGRMALLVDGKTVAEGKAPGPVAGEPGDSLQIGADLIKPVGEYAVPNPFAGTIRRIRLEVR
jgi:arylsulfatase